MTDDSNKSSQVQFSIQKLQICLKGVYNLDNILYTKTKKNSKENGRNILEEQERRHT